MHNINLNTPDGRQGFEKPEEFGEEFLGICRDHHEQGRALAFSVILFDRKWAELEKVLYDHAYWQALNSISREYLTIFSFCTPFEMPRPDYDGIRPATTGEAHVDYLQQWFKEPLKLDRPVVIFFQVQDEEVIAAEASQIEGNSVESAFQDLRGIFSAAAGSLEKIRPEFAGNRMEIFNRISEAMMQRNTVKLLKMSIPFLGQIPKVVKFLTGLH